MNIRFVQNKDTESLFHMMCILDEETPFMMYEPGERKKNINAINNLKHKINNASDDFILIAENRHGEIVGYIWAERGRFNRILHTAYIVIGIRKEYQQQGIGTEFFKQLDQWAKANGIVRLELTVECNNMVAKHLYEKYGFVVEGIRRKSMKLDHEFVDEFYMAKLL